MKRGLVGALLCVLVFLSCSSNPSVHRLVVPDALIPVNTKGDRVKMGVVASRVPGTDDAGVVELLRDAIEQELEERDLIWPYSMHTVSADIISYRYRDHDAINKGPIVWWLLPAIPLGIRLSPSWTIPFVCASAMSYGLDRATKVGEFLMTVNVKIHKKGEEILSKNVVIDLARRDIPPERALAGEICALIADKVAAAVR